MKRFLLYWLLLFSILPIAHVNAQVSKKQIFYTLVNQNNDALGLSYLKQNAKIFYDFTNTPGADGAAITSVQDLSRNNVDASNVAPAQDPAIMYSQWGANMIPTVKAFASSGTTKRDILISNTFGENEIKSDFEVIWVGAPITEGDRDLFGVATGTNVFRANIISNKIRFEYRYSAATARRFVAETTSTVYVGSSVPSGLKLYRVKFDFTNDVFKFWIDGVEQAMTSLVDAFNLIDPTKWANVTNKLGVGGYNNGGTIGLYGNYHLMKNFAITPIMDDHQVVYVSDYLMNGGVGYTKKIVPFSSLKNNPIRKTTSNTTHTFAFSLSEPPTSDVTVTLAGSLSKYTRSSSSYTFTSSNWATPQSLTLTATNDGVTDMIVTDQLVFTCSGGGYDAVTLTLPLLVYDNTSITNLNTFFGHDTWSESLHVTTSATAATAITSAINYFFNGNGIPSGTSNVSVTNGFTGSMHLINTSVLSADVASVDRYTITWTDVDGATWTHYAFLCKSTTGGNAKLLIDVLGVQSTDTYNHELLIESAAASGIDVLYMGMPVVGLNTETSAKVTSTQTAGWNQMVSNALDAPGYSAVELFFFDIAKSLNYIEANYSYSSIGITGIHAGGWAALVYGTLDPRITKVFPIRGLNPLALDSGGGPYPLGDNLTNNGATLWAFYNNTVSLVDYFAMSGLTKYIKQMDHTIDFSSSYTTARYWKPLLEERIGVTYDSYVSTAAGTSAAAYYADYITEILSEL